MTFVGLRALIGVNTEHDSQLSQPFKAVLNDLWQIRRNCAASRTGMEVPKPWSLTWMVSKWSRNQTLKEKGTLFLKLYVYYFVLKKLIIMNYYLHVSYLWCLWHVYSNHSSCDSIWGKASALDDPKQYQHRCLLARKPLSDVGLIRFSPDSPENQTSSQILDLHRYISYIFCSALFIVLQYFLCMWIYLLF